MTVQIEKLSLELEERANRVRLHEQRYGGDSPISFLSAEARKNLSRLTHLNLNLCRLAVDALAERIKPNGFTVDGSTDEALWRLWRGQEMEVGALQAVTDALMCGTGYVSVWGDGEGPLVNVEDPAQCLVRRDPMTRQPVLGFKRWADEGRGYCVVYGLDRVTSYGSKANVTDATAMPASGWEVIGSVPNPLGAIPLVQITNKGRINQPNGVSDMDAIKDANDALVKVFVDQLTTSEAYSRPRRWVTGLEISEDNDGVPVDPFAGSERTWMAEDPETKFGQFSESDLTGYDTLTRSLLGQISALSGLPAHYLFSDQQPSSGEEVRAKEISLVARAEAKIIAFTAPFSQVARLAVAVRDGRDPRKVLAEVSWADPATRTLAQEADAIVKLASGERPVLPLSEARRRLGYNAEQVKALERADAVETALRIAEAS